MAESAAPRILPDPRGEGYRVTYRPTQRQQLLHSTPATQILYGGAAGGGKSVGIRWDAYQFCLQNPGMAAYLFRKSRPELKRNHIDFIMTEIPQELASYNKQDAVLEFANRSKLYFCFCDSDDDVKLYQGAEMHWLGLDEATHFTPFQINYLRTRLRLGSFQVRDTRFLPRMVLATNPQGGPGHSIIKRVFVDPAPPETPFRDKTTAIKERKDAAGEVVRPKFEGKTTIFIPSKMSDNPHLDEDYEGQFNGLPAELAKALIDGDWGTVVGAALHNLSEKRHMLPQLKLLDPKRRDPLETNHWTHFQVIDWGTAKPFSVGWYCVADHGFEIKCKRRDITTYVPEGAVIRFAEWYGCEDGKEDTGIRMPSEAVARGIRQREDRWGLPKMDYRIGDSQMWAQSDGPSPQEKMGRHQVFLRQAKKDRQANYEEVLSRLAGNPTYVKDKGKTEQHPMFFVTEGCESFWRTVPSLVLDETDPDKGPAKVRPKQEDHVYDEVGYGLRSRPFVIDADQRFRKDADSYKELYQQAQEEAGSTSVDPYYTG